MVLPCVPIQICGFEGCRNKGYDEARGEICNRKFAEVCGEPRHMVCNKVDNKKSIKVATKVRNKIDNTMSTKVATKKSTKIHNEEGQMTVELAVIFPLVLIIAVIACNAIVFFSECAAFDRSAKEAIRVCASAPAYGEGLEESRASIQAFLEKSYKKNYLSTSVSVSAAVRGHTTFSAQLIFTPNLFGLGAQENILGVPLPKLHHTTCLTLDRYKPGVLL